MENSRRCEICNVDVHRASMQTHLRKKTYLENEKQNQNVIPEWLFKEEQAPIKNKLIKVYNPKPLKQIARERIKINDEELENQLAKKIINPYYFSDEISKKAFEINLESLNINHATPVLTNTPNFLDF